MSQTKLFVGGLNWGTNDAELRRVFERYGEVIDAKVVTDPYTERSRGFGYVTFAKEQSAQEALSALDQSVVEGRQIRVSFAQDDGERRLAEQALPAQEAW